MKWLAVGVLVIALGVAAWWRFGRDEATHKPAKPVGEAGASPSDAPADGPAGSAPSASPEKAKVKAAHQLLVQQIEQARQRRLAALAREGAAASKAPTPSIPSLVDEPPSPLDSPLAKDYIRERMRDIQPLLQECYETAMVMHPELAAGGTITITFRMAGEPGVGGVILDNKIVPEKSTLAAAPYLAECVTESIYAMRFDPPAAGGFVDVNYPFIFQTSDATPDGGP
ncbi:MAG: AgmX/PglI C-terminal domain-containing protein [Deltaproteobacteria bacterium]|nr:AgmX/PglI C-terminal domain-containing protein [Deltaproteobacteria bacterium]